MIDSDSFQRSFFETVLLRPRMYTIHGTYGEVVAFLQGYISGIAKENPSNSLVMEWYDFTRWLSTKLNVDSAEVFVQFFNINGDDKNSVKALIAALHQFYRK